MHIRTAMLAAASMLTIGVVAPAISRADLLDTQSNPVANEFAGSYWYNPDAWSAIPKYPGDPTGDGSPIDGFDWSYTQVAHDSNYLYLHYYNNASFAGDRQLTYFDTDSNAETGLPGFTGTLAVGAEYFLSGAGWNAVDDQGGSTFSGWVNWNNVQDGEGNWHILAAIPRFGDEDPETGNLPSGLTSFSFVNQNHDQGGDDWYPDAGNNFPGDYFRYEVTQPTVDAFGRTWNVFEPTHRDNADVTAEITGGANELSLTGVFGGFADTRAVTPLTVEIGTRVSYDFALTHDQVDRAGDGTFEAWVADAFGAFVNSGSDPSNAGLLTTRVGASPFDDEATRIQFNDIAAGEEGSVSLLDATETSVEHHLAEGVHVEWLFTSETTAEVSIFSADGSTQLGDAFVDTIADIAAIQGFRFNLFDSEQTLSISNFTVDLVEIEDLQGDYNGDGVVDAADYTVWRDTFGQTVAAGDGADGNGDTMVNAEDYEVWSSNYGAALSSGADAVAAPEPGAALLALLAASAVTRVRRRVW